MSTRRTLLIVEDDVDLNEIYKMFSVISVDMLKRAGLAVAVDVLQAFTYQEALDILNSRTIDFISIDLALREEDRGLDEVERRSGKQPGGMQLLIDLADLPHRPLAVVVSGETLLSYARDALQKYGALAYYQKGQPGGEDKYIHAVQAVLWYLEAAELLAKLEQYAAGPDGFKRASECWEKARKEAELAEASERGFPHELQPRIDAARLRLDPVAKLPGDVWTEQALRSRVLQRTDWAILQVEIYNYADFTAKQASQAGPIFFHVSDLIEKAGAQNACPEPFTGIWWHERAGGPCLLAILQKTTAGQAEKVAAWTNAEFQKIASQFSDSFQPDQRLPILAIRIWDGANHPFGDWQDLVNRLNQTLT